MANAVYGVILNFRAELESLGDQLYRDPYKKPPVAPVLYLRPRNTWNTSGSAIRMPPRRDELKMAGTMGVVIGAGYVAVNDVSIPHASYYRPAIRQRCRDGFCVIGSEISGARAAEKFEFRSTESSDAARALADLVRPIDRLIADISEFLTLQPGDIVLIGEPPDAPLGHGRRSRPSGNGRSGPPSRTRLSRNEMRARSVCWRDPSTPPNRTGGLRLADGRVVDDDDVVWLPPIQPGTIFALGLTMPITPRNWRSRRPTSRWCS